MSRTVFEAGYSVTRPLRRELERFGASEAELAALRRLALGKAELGDLERLEPTARAAALPWGELFPELAEQREASQQRARAHFSEARRLAGEATELLKGVRS